MQRSNHKGKEAHISEGFKKTKDSDKNTLKLTFDEETRMSEEGNDTLRVINSLRTTPPLGKGDTRMTICALLALALALCMVTASVTHADVNAGSFTLHNLSRSPDRREGEAVVVIDPKSTQHAVLAFVVDPRIKERLCVYRTADGGKTWVSVQLPGEKDGSVGGGNPAVTADRFGNLFLAYLTHDDMPVRTVILVSSDHGEKWREVWSANAFLDQPSLTVSTPDTNGKSSLWIVGGGSDGLQAFAGDLKEDGSITGMESVTIKLDGEKVKGDVKGGEIIDNQAKIVARGQDSAWILYQRCKFGTDRQARSEKLRIVRVSRVNSRWEAKPPSEIMALGPQAVFSHSQLLLTHHDGKDHLWVLSPQNDSLILRESTDDGMTWGMPKSLQVGPVFYLTATIDTARSTLWASYLAVETVQQPAFRQFVLLYDLVSGKTETYGPIESTPRSIPTDPPLNRVFGDYAGIATMDGCVLTTFSTNCPEFDGVKIPPTFSDVGIAVLVDHRKP